MWVNVQDQLEAIRIRISWKTEKIQNKYLWGITEIQDISMENGIERYLEHDIRERFKGNGISNPDIKFLDTETIQVYKSTCCSNYSKSESKNEMYNQ